MLQLQGISKIYRTSAGEVRALDGVDLTIEKGEFAAVVGRSGSGKSTLMHILGCLDLPSAGRYRFGGTDCTRLGKTGRAALRNREIGFVFQSFNLLPYCTALENVELPLAFRGLTPARRRQLAYDALEAVGLADRSAHRPSELSGGQQQRVAVARAIAASPSLLLADEPTGNLDPKSTEQILELLESFHERGKTVVLITHDRSVAERAGRQIVLEQGKLAGQYPNLPESESSFSIHSF
ncbi:MAG: ABC transporter ATP-binding protein [Clostridiaceae bacterium]|nr:ABC transporter ATP-binding protein [Clostridiales bacterium]MDD6878247.1 ABC transporter ATP-binding protein [Clostridiaceae bacterium]MDY3072998.1 ABC transporter ATP-binding protein [Eubacteriales bacterium]